MWDALYSVKSYWRFAHFWTLSGGKSQFKIAKSTGGRLQPILA